MTRLINLKISVSLWVCNYLNILSINLYFLNLVLHPRHKLKYFKDASWEQDWIDTAKDIVQAEFNRSYAKSELSDDESDFDTVPQVSF